MLIDHKNILIRFSEHLNWATHLDIATAWATSNEGLRSLQTLNSPVRVRAVVGLWGHLTEPIALRTLAEIGELRLVNPTRRFHPKVFLFRGAGKRVCWIGSANFTSGGFGMNEEVMFETTATQTVAAWFNQLWQRCGPLGARDIEQYAISRIRNPPQQMTPPPTPAATAATLDHPVELLREVCNWRSYVDALEQCDGWWSNGFWWSVLGEFQSWSATIHELHNIVVHRNWHTLQHDERHRVLGLVPDGEGWALLGRMRRPAMQTVFGGELDTIQQTVKAAAFADDSAFPEAAVHAFSKLTKVSGVGPGIATRLLALARPDRFVSLNSASKPLLARSFGVAPTTLDQPRNYGRLLEQIYSKAWHREPDPIDAREQTIRWMRAALLDCFVYQPQSNR